MSANFPGTFKVDIPDYRNTGLYQMIGVTNAGFVGLTGGASLMKTVEGTWADITPVSSLTLVSASGGNFISGSSFYLYGTI